jgi:hypothetical protein
LVEKVQKLFFVFEQVGKIIKRIRDKDKEQEERGGKERWKGKR